MRIAFDIGNASFQHSRDGRYAGIYRASSMMAKSLLHDDQTRVVFASKESQMQNAYKYSSSLRLAPADREVISIERCSRERNNRGTFETYFDVLHVNWRGLDKPEEFHAVPVAYYLPDLIPKKYPQFFDDTLLHDSLRQHDLMLKDFSKLHQLIVTTREVKNDVLDFYPSISEEQISIVPLFSDLNYDFSWSSESNSLPNDLPNAPYILSVGTQEPRKNLGILLDAYQELAMRNQNNRFPALVLVGRKGWLTPYDSAQVERIQEIRNANVIFIEDASDTDLKNLYQNATLFCFPSFSEGFGLPVYESLSFGVPTLVADIPAYDGLSKESLVRFDPNDTLELTGKLEKVIFDMTQSEIENLRRFSLLQASLYNQQQTARELRTAYQAVIDRSKNTRKSDNIRLLDTFSSGHGNARQSVLPKRPKKLWFVGPKTSEITLARIDMYDAVIWMGERAQIRHGIECQVFGTYGEFMRTTFDESVKENKPHGRLKWIVDTLEAELVYVDNSVLGDLSHVDFDYVIVSASDSLDAISYDQDEVRIDEANLVFSYFRFSGSEKGTMFDVGAHRGSSLVNFAALGWHIHAFEPDQKNVRHLKTKFGRKSNVHIREIAVSDEIGNREFFRSEVSSGISSLVPFHDLHQGVGQVETTTLANYVSKESVTHVDFLKIDVEGHELEVLRGFPFFEITPEVISAEFEQGKTIHVGYKPSAIADLLVDKGYSVYVFEWFPIREYGTQHSFKSVYRYKSKPIDHLSWGNLVAFKHDPGFLSIYRFTLGAVESLAPNENGYSTRLPSITIKDKLIPIFLAVNSKSPELGSLLSRIWNFISR